MPKTVRRLVVQAGPLLGGLDRQAQLLPEDMQQRHGQPCLLEAIAARVPELGGKAHIGRPLGLGPREARRWASCSSPLGEALSQGLVAVLPR